MDSPDEREPSGEIFWRVLQFAPGASLRFGVRVVGVDQFLAASAAMRPENPGIAATGVGFPSPPQVGFPKWCCSLREM